MPQIKPPFILFKFRDFYLFPELDFLVNFNYSNIQALHYL
jgi:hypothetical protein